MAVHEKKLKRLETAVKLFVKYSFKFLLHALWFEQCYTKLVFSVFQK